MASKKMDQYFSKVINAEKRLFGECFINGKNKNRWTRYSIFQWVYPIQILFSVTNDNLTVTVDFIIF